MTKIMTILLLCFAVAGCASTKPEYIETTKVKFITIDVDKSLFEIPPHNNIDLTKPVSDADISTWIINLEKRSILLESKLQAIAVIVQKYNENAANANKELSDVKSK